MNALFSTILDMSLTGTLVILAVLVVRLILWKAPRRISYPLWSVVLFRLLCPVSLSLPGSALSVAVQTVDAIQVTTEIGRTSSITYLPPAVSPADPGLSFQSLLPWLWAAGVAFLSLRTAVEYVRLRRQLIGAVALKNRVYLSDRIASPFVLGLWKPKIYLPSHTPREEYRYIISHERCHIHRGDHIVKLLAYGALCLHWFNPLVWLAFRLAGQDMEMSCDEMVMQVIGPQVRPAYAQTLVRQSSGVRNFAATPLSFGAGDVKRRVLHLARWKQPNAWMTVIAVILCAAALILFAINPQNTAPVQHPGVAINLPQTMALDTDEAGNQIITDGVYTLGGIRRYQSKGGDFDVTTPMKCFKDIGLPQLTDGIERDSMIESSLYGDWQAWFHHPDEGEATHYFFFQGDVITEIWFYAEVVHPDLIQSIMESVSFGQSPEKIIAIPQNTTLSTETFARYRCRAILEELQSYDSYKVHTLKEDAMTKTPMSDSTYWRSGDRWMRSDISPNGPVWSKNGNGEDSIPWLFSYQWKEQEVVHVSTIPTDDGERIEIAIDAPYDESSTDTYYVTFHFDPLGAFQKATISAFYRNAGTNTLEQCDYTQYILSLDEHIITEELDAQ